MTVPNFTTSKACCNCGQEKPLSDFYPKKDGRDGFASQCKVCYGERQRELKEIRTQERWEKQRRESGVIGPDTRILDDAGRDWAWAFVIFREPPGWPGYLVGSNGSVWCCRIRGGGKGRLSGRWNPIKNLNGGHGYAQVNLSKNLGRNVPQAVHRLVMSAFYGPTPEGKEVCHNNGDRKDPRLCNLRFDTSKGNQADKRIHGTLAQGSRIGTSKLQETDIPFIRSLAASGLSHTEIGGRFGVSRTTIRVIVEGKYWRHVE